MYTKTGPVSDAAHGPLSVYSASRPLPVHLTSRKVVMLLVLVLVPGGVSADSKPGTGHSTDEWLGTTVLLDSTYRDRQFNGSAGKMLAVSTDDIIHGVSTIGDMIHRRVMAWCVDPTSLSLEGPVAVLNGISNNGTMAVTGAQPANGQPPNTSVVAFNTLSPTLSWFGSDWSGCISVFDMVQQAVPELMWPHIAIDSHDRIHMVSYGSALSSTPGTHFYNSSANGVSWDPGSFQVLTSDSRVPGSIPVANTHSERAAVVFFEITGPEDVPYDGSEESELGGRLHHDVKAFIALDGDLTAEIMAENVHDLTAFGPGSPAPFGPYGARACGDVDGLFDMTVGEHLHLVYTTAPIFSDTLTVYGRSGTHENVVYHTGTLDRGQIWHLDVDAGIWSLVAGSNCGISEQDFSDHRSEAWRMRHDAPQLAIDPATGYLYTIWSEYSPDDVSSEDYYNGEIMARCSADNGQSWGPAVNLTDTPSPGCPDGHCDSEDWASMATYAAGGFLHISFVHDKNPGFRIEDPPEPWYYPNPVYYMKVPVDLVPPHTGTPWDTIGRVGLIQPYRLQEWPCSAWSGEGAFLDSALWVEPVHIFNESPADVQLQGISFHRAPDDAVTLEMEVLLENGWLPVEEWDGLLPHWRGTKFRARLAYDRLPEWDQLLVFRMDGRPDLVYRFTYPATGSPGCPGVSTLDPADLSGTFEQSLFSGTALEPTLPVGFTLEPNWPNPFNPTTTIAFTLDHAGAASLTVHNLLGETVATLVDSPVQAGRHTVDFDASALASGVYIYTLEAGEHRESRKLVLMK